jgi:hypothetical protein
MPARAVKTVLIRDGIAGSLELCVGLTHACRGGLAKKPHHERANRNRRHNQQQYESKKPSL